MSRSTHPFRFQGWAIRRLCTLLVVLVLLSPQGLVADVQTAPERSPFPPERAAASFIGALRAADLGEWARAIEQVRRADPLARDLIEWRRLRAGAGDWETARALLARRPDWPDAGFLRRRTEALIPANAPAAEVRAFFGTDTPATAAGAFALALALADAGEAGAAEAEARRAWRTLTMDADLEIAFLARFGQALSRDHAARADTLLWRGDRTGASRMIDRLPDGPRQLAAARLALQTRASGVDGLIAEVPAGFLGDAGLAHDRFHWRMTSRFYDSAIELLLERSVSAEALGQPQGWAARRAWLARRALAAGDAALAYRIASSHHLEDGGAFADLEWLAGYIALRALDRPAAALGHFRALRQRVGSPISLGRAGYWEGRALEAMRRPDEAREAYAFGAQHQTAFYGQLAAERAGLPMDPGLIDDLRPPDWRGAPFVSSDLFAAGAALYRAGSWYDARRFFLQLGATLSGDQLQQFADFLLEGLNEPNFAVQLAKDAVGRGEVVMRAYFPVTELATMDLPIPPELALAIARRESEFDAGIVSPANAQGLMQVLPSTAELVARRLDMPFDASRLLGDPAYNAVIGAAYLADLIEEFGPSLILVASGYNAGPGRPRRWIEDLGDPRQADVDVVDWIESIPFTETRNYVMRVMEALVIYRARLAGQTLPFRSEADLRGG